MDEDKSNRLVSVVIVTCAVKDYLKHCLDSLKGQTHQALEIIAIDDSLRQDSCKDISGSFPEIKLSINKQRLFYGGSLNKGIEASKGDFILCLNDDVVLDRSFIENALKAFFLDSRIGMVSGKILRQDGKTIDSTGLFLTFWRTAKERGYGSIDNGRFEKEGYIFGVSGAVAFYRKKMLDKIKEKEYFDPTFGLFYEDLDIAWRAQRAGWKGYYIPSAIAYHLRGGTVRQESGINKPCARRFLEDALHADLIRNRYATINKNESPLGFLLHLPAILMYEILAWGYILLFKRSVIKVLFR